jgi:hypothetical protein
MSQPFLLLGEGRHVGPMVVDMGDSMLSQHSQGGRGSFREPRRPLLSSLREQQSLLLLMRQTPR